MIKFPGPRVLRVIGVAGDKTVAGLVMASDAPTPIL